MGNLKLKKWSFKSSENQIFASYDGGDWCDLFSITDLDLSLSRNLLQSLSHLYYFMWAEPKKTDIILPKILLKKDIKESLTFFGGSFNPWHLGHMACLNLCPHEHIMVIPDHNPWKNDIDHKGCPWEFFKDLCLKLKESNYSVYPGFLPLEKGNPTIKWLPQVSVEKKWLLIGEDNFVSLPSWLEVRELVKHLQGLYICPRLESKNERKEVIELLKTWNSQLEMIFLDDHQYRHLSSRQMRKSKSQ